GAEPARLRPAQGIRKPEPWWARVLLALALERAVPRSLEGVATAREQPERGETGDAEDREDPGGGQRSGRPATGAVQGGSARPGEDQAEADQRVERPLVDHRVQAVGPQRALVAGEVEGRHEGRDHEGESGGERREQAQD